jgi:hypothetical protein
MVIVVKDGKEEKVPHAVDVPGWLGAGWKIKGEKEPKKPGRPPSKKEA